MLFITNDEKSDWVYAPKMRKAIVAGARKSISNTNPEIKLADPRLISEFQRKTGHPHFVISSLATLVEGLSKVSATLFAQLAAAIQTNTQEAEPPLTVSPEPQATELGDPAELVEPPALPIDAPPVEVPPVEVPSDVPPGVPDEPEPPRLNYAQEALQDSQYQADAPSEINAIIRALKSLNWYTQNPAIVSIRAIHHEEFSPSSWFVLGRNIYQAACGNSQKAMEFMAALETQLRQFPEAIAQHILAGMLFEVYFDAQGQFREKAKFSYADKPLSLVADHAYEDVRAFILFHLHNHRQRLKFMPGDRNQMALCIVSVPIEQQDGDTPRGATHELRSVTLDGVELMRDLAPPADDAWARLLARSKMRQETVRAVASEELAIPRWALTNHFDPPVPGDVQFVVPKGRELHPRLALEVPGPAAQR